MSIPLQLQTKANLYTPDVRITDTDLLGYDGDPSLATDDTDVGQAALMNAAVSSFYCDNSGNLYLKTSSATWQALSTSSSGANYYAAVTEIETANGEEALIVRNDTVSRDPGISKITTEADTITLSLVWERINTTNLAYSGAVPLINGTPVPEANITTTNDYDKMQFGTFEYTIPTDDTGTVDVDERDIVITYGGETFTIDVVKAEKPTASFANTLPALPWDNATAQSSYKANDLFTIDITNVSEAVDMYRIIGGVDGDSVFDANIEDTLTGVDDANDGQIQVAVPAVVTQGTKNFSIQVRATATRAWSDAFEFTNIPCDPRTPTTTLAHSYPANQTALKDNEQDTITATVNHFDEIQYTETSDAQWDASSIGFTSDTGANTWGLLVTTTTLSGDHRYSNNKVGEVRYRSFNGTEVTYDVNVRFSNRLPQMLSHTQGVASHAGSVANITVTFDQPPLNYTSSTVTDSLPIHSETANTTEAGPWTIDYVISRDAADTVDIRDITIAGMAGPANVASPVDIVTTDAILYNGFAPSRYTLPSSVRTGNVPVQVDLTNHRGTFTCAWDTSDGQGNQTLTAVFDENLSGTPTANTWVLLTQNANGTLDYEILYSDVTILQTFFTIGQTDTHP